MLVELIDAPPVCRHCGTERVNRPRGLCWSCYYTPRVRDRYPPNPKYRPRPSAGEVGPAPLPAEPTAALPGTEEKLQVLEARAARGEALFHPDDGPPGDD